MDVTFHSNEADVNHAGGEIHVKDDAPVTDTKPQCPGFASDWPDVEDRIKRITLEMI